MRKTKIHFIGLPTWVFIIAIVHSAPTLYSFLSLSLASLSRGFLLWSGLSFASSFVFQMHQVSVRSSQSHSRQTLKVSNFFSPFLLRIPCCECLHPCDWLSERAFQSPHVFSLHTPPLLSLHLAACRLTLPRGADPLSSDQCFNYFCPCPDLTLCPLLGVTPSSIGLSFTVTHLPPLVPIWGGERKKRKKKENGTAR